MESTNIFIKQPKKQESGCKNMESFPSLHFLEMVLDRRKYPWMESSGAKELGFYTKALHLK